MTQLNMKATPGPWTADVQYIIRDSNGDEIATCAIAAQLLSARANAALIAAAPDMLDLARNVAGLDDQYLANTNEGGLRVLIREWRKEARAAIAKAEGTS
jgi:hypothetical protein